LASHATLLQTQNLIIRKLAVDDAPFIFELVNMPSWLQYIGDRGVKTLHDAEQYITNGPMASYEKFGFGLYLVALKDTQEPVGMCGLLKRDTLDNPDIGFAFLRKFTGKGYAFEAATEVLTYGKSVLGLTRILAITTKDNASSIKLLGRLGFEFEKHIMINAEELNLLGKNV
jgi:[ribosomal protein S5]-alanine N-acetyltransferase